MYSFQVSIKPGYIAYFNVEVFVPKKEGQYIGDIEMETDYEVGDALSSDTTVGLLINIIVI